VADVSAAVHGSAAIMGALLRRERTGRGQHIDMSMLDVMVSMLVVVASRYLHTGEVPERHGTENPARVPSAAFECADGRYLQVVPNQRQWPAFCELLGHPGWTSDLRFATPSARVDNADVLNPMVSAALRAKSADEWERLFTSSNVACSAINDMSEVFDHEQVQHRELVQEYTGPDGDARLGLALPFRFSETPARIRNRPPLLGEHTVQVLEELGRDKEQIAWLLQAGIVSENRPASRGEDE
jgi:crotonobetainyl-CoA:carnitine CoA-transferase CaiB-like acyl-CoA transferase